MKNRVESPRRSFLGRMVAGITGGAWLSSIQDVRPAQAAPEGFAQPFVGEIRMFGGTNPPAGWMMCEGQILPISENDTLFNLIGTTYGGDGQETFALPDLRGRAPIHQGPGFVLGQNGGQEDVTLTGTQIPIHTHTALASSTPGTSDSPAGMAPATSVSGVTQYAETVDTSLSATAILSTGGSQPHTNMQPWLGVSYMISLYGIWPSQ
jgi:microcystin-dependent protein